MHLTPHYHKNNGHNKRLQQQIMPQQSEQCLIWSLYDSIYHCIWRK